MRWKIPAKTFLLGEYVALKGGPALILTTSPCFELHKAQQLGLQGIHPESPGGRWWLHHGLRNHGLEWYDPYQGRGGMGASSAQFLGTYLASREGEQHIELSRQSMLNDYLNYAWQGRGIPPSGYDVLAQSNHGCVYINQQEMLFESYPWPFVDLEFILLHTGRKLATHQHLQSMTMPNNLREMTEIVEAGKNAFESQDSLGIIKAVNNYHHCLKQENLIAEHSLDYIKCINQQLEVLAAKGCGAMGADVVLLLVANDKLNSTLDFLKENSNGRWNLLATSQDLYLKQPLINAI